MCSTTQKELSDADLSRLSSGSSGSDSSKWKVHEAPQDSGLVPTIAVTLWLGWNGFVLWIILYAIFFAGLWGRMAVFGLLTLSLILPVSFPGKWGDRFGEWMMLQAEKYFGEWMDWRRHGSDADCNSHPSLSCLQLLGLKTVIEDEEDLIRHSKENKALIFAFNPHDMVRSPL